MRTGSRLVRVLPDPSGGWHIREPGSTGVLGHAADKDKAVLRAQALMMSGGVVQVLDHGGVLVKTYTVPGPSESPWWYVPSLPLFWIIGGLFLLQGIFGVVTHVVGGFQFWLYLVMGLTGLLYLAQVAGSRRRARRLMMSDG